MNYLVHIYTQRADELKVAIDSIEALCNQTHYPSSFAVKTQLHQKAEELRLDDEPHFIVMDFELGMDAIMEILNAYQGIPLMLLADGNSSVIQLEEMVLRGAYCYLTLPLDQVLLEKKIDQIFGRIKYFDSYSNVMINALMRFHSSEDIAAKMISVAHVACKRFRISEAQTSDIYRILKILSIAIKDSSVIKTFKLFEDLRIANSILELLQDSLRPKKQVSSIISLIYNFERMKLKNRPIESYRNEEIDSTLYEEIRSIFQNKEIFIENGYDLESVWVDLIEVLNNHQVGTDSDVDTFIGEAMQITRRVLIYYGGGIVKISQKVGEVVYMIAPQEMDEFVRWCNTRDETPSPETGVQVEIREDSCLISIKRAAPAETQEEAGEGDEFFDFDKDSNLLEKEIYEGLKYTDGATRLITPASEYLASIRESVDISEYLDGLLDIEEQFEDSLHEDASLSSHALEKASDCLNKYASFLSQLDEFRELSYIVYALSSVIRNTDHASILKQEKKIYTLLTALIDDLKGWKNNIFILSEAKDIHYLDDSLLSSCSMLESMINQGGENPKKDESDEDDSDDLELF